MKITQTLLRKYIAGQCTEAEMRFIEQWMNSAEGVRSDYSHEEVSEMKKGTWDKLRKKYQLQSSFSEKREKKRCASSSSLTIPTIFSLRSSRLRHHRSFCSGFLHWVHLRQTTSRSGKGG